MGVGNRNLLEGSAHHGHAFDDHLKRLNILESIILSTKLCAIPHRLPCQSAGLSRHRELDQTVAIRDRDMRHKAWLGKSNRALRVAVPKEKAHLAGTRVGHDLQLSDMVSELNQHAANLRMWGTMSMTTASIRVIRISAPSTTGGES